MFPIRHARVIAIIAFATILGCQERPTSTSARVDDESANHVAQPHLDANAPATRSASLTIGDESYDFNSVTCIGMNPATGIATDRANRDNYPTVTLKVFDATLSGGEVINTVSVQFRSESRDELWLLQDGDVEKDGKIFEASGTLKGRRMVTQANGTLKSAPFEDSDVRPFHARLQCR